MSVDTETIIDKNEDDMNEEANKDENEILNNEIEDVENKDTDSVVEEWKKISAELARQNEEMKKMLNEFFKNGNNPSEPVNDFDKYFDSEESLTGRILKAYRGD